MKDSQPCDQFITCNRTAQVRQAAGGMLQLLTLETDIAVGLLCNTITKQLTGDIQHQKGNVKA